VLGSAVMLRGILFLGLFGLACSAGDNGGDSFECDPRRLGTYRTTYTTLDGTCGDQAGGVGRLDNDAPLPEGCELTAPDIWSADGCKLDRALRCNADAIAPGAVTEFVAVSTQANASLITGTMTMDVFDSGGQLVCTGTYSLRAEKL
jgi:hypothetical protein